MPVLLLAMLGNMRRGVWLDPRLRYKLTSPRYSGELPVAETNVIMEKIEGNLTLDKRD
jgi:hypothetical protein